MQQDLTQTLRGHVFKTKKKKQETEKSPLWIWILMVWQEGGNTALPLGASQYLEFQKEIPTESGKVSTPRGGGGGDNNIDSHHHFHHIYKKVTAVRLIELAKGGGHCSLVVQSSLWVRQKRTRCIANLC